MMVGAEKAQISLGVIARIPIDMVEMNRYPTSVGISFRPSADLTALAILFNEVSTNMKGGYVEAGRCAVDLPG